MLCIAALLGVFATTVSFAEEAGGNATPDPGSAKPQDTDTSGNGSGPGSNNAGNAGDNGGNKGSDHDMRNGGRSGAPPSSANAKGGNTGPNPGAKSGGVASHTGIDLVTPDNGYANLRRRAQRKVLGAIAAKKHATPGSIAINNPNIHPAPGTVTGIGQSRNAIGMPMTTGVAGVGHHGPEFMHPATTGTTGVALHPPPVHVNAAPPIHITGVNGTTMGHVGPGTIGGPANIHTGVNGTTLRRKY